MNRSGYYDAYDLHDQWQHILWRGQVASAIRGKRGQAFLRELIAALDAMPVKRLVTKNLINDGAVCAIGSVGVARGTDMSKLDPEDADAIAAVFGIAHQLVREIEYVNDDITEHETPEQRWHIVRQWALNHLKEKPL